MIPRTLIKTIPERITNKFACVETNKRNLTMSISIALPSSITTADCDGNIYNTPRKKALEPLQFPTMPPPPRFLPRRHVSVSSSRGIVPTPLFVPTLDESREGADNKCFTLGMKQQSDFFEKQLKTVPPILKMRNARLSLKLAKAA
jgi:hypothetical protein